MICENSIGQQEVKNVVNINKLKGRIVESGSTIETLADAIGMNRATLYRKINANGETFSVGEVDRIVRALKLDAKEATSIFFSQFVA